MHLIFYLELFLFNHSLLHFLLRREKRVSVHSSQLFFKLLMLVLEPPELGIMFVEVLFGFLFRHDRPPG